MARRTSFDIIIMRKFICALSQVKHAVRSPTPCHAARIAYVTESWYIRCDESGCTSSPSSSTCTGCDFGCMLAQDGKVFKERSWSSVVSSQNSGKCCKASDLDSSVHDPVMSIFVSLEL